MHLHLALGVALAASVAANVWLYEAVSAGRPVEARPVPTEATRPVARGAIRSVTTPFAECIKGLSDTKAELARTQGDLESRIEAATRFAAAEREKALEERVTPAIERALARAKGITGTVECRGDTCQVRVSADNRANAKAAWATFTTDPEIGEFADSFTMAAGEPVTDVVTGKGAFDVDYFITTKSTTDLTPRLEDLVARYRASSAAAACLAKSQDRGALEAKIALVADERTLSLAVGGSLAGTPIGKCLAAVLSTAVAAFEVPAGVTYGEVYATFEAPPSS